MTILSYLAGPAQVFNYVLVQMLLHRAQKVELYELLDLCEDIVILLECSSWSI